MKPQSVMITGASGEIGAAIAEVFARNGCQLCLCCRSPKKLESLKACAQQMSDKYSVNVTTWLFDVSDKAQCKEAVKQAVAAMGSLDVLVNNAGIIDYALLIREREEEYRAVISANQDGTFFLMQEAGAVMKKQRSGSIVNTSSVAGLKGCIGSSAYAASKGAINALTMTAAAELAAYGIRVNAVGGAGNDRWRYDESAQRRNQSTLCPVLRNEAVRHTGRGGRGGLFSRFSGSVLYYRTDSAGRWRNECVNRGVLWNIKHHFH